MNGWRHALGWEEINSSKNNSYNKCIGMPLGGTCVGDEVNGLANGVLGDTCGGHENLPWGGGGAAGNTPGRGVEGHGHTFQSTKTSKKGIKANQPTRSTTSGGNKKGRRR